MPQWRKLHAKILESLDVAAMPDDLTRLTWVLLPLVLDRKGRASDSALVLRNKLYPARSDVTPEQVEQALAWFAVRGMIVRYAVDGRQYLLVPTFAAYQGKTDRETASTIPDPDSCQPSAHLREARGPLQKESALEVDSDSDSDSDSEEMQAGASAPATAEPAQGPEAVPEQSKEPEVPAAVRVFLEQGGKFPGGKLADGTTRRDRAISYIAEHVRATPESLALWGRVVAGYQMQWSAKSYTVMITDYYLRGRIPGDPGGNGQAPPVSNGHGPPGRGPEPKGYAGMREYLSRKAARNGKPN